MSLQGGGELGDVGQSVQISSGDVARSTQGRLQGKLLVWLTVPDTQAGELKSHLGYTCHSMLRGLRAAAGHPQHPVTFTEAPPWGPGKATPPPQYSTASPRFPHKHTHLCAPVAMLSPAACFIRVAVASPAAFYGCCGSKSCQGLAIGWRQHSGLMWRILGGDVETCFGWIEVKRLTLMIASLEMLGISQKPSKPGIVGMAK